MKVTMMTKKTRAGSQSDGALIQRMKREHFIKVVEEERRWTRSHKNFAAAFKCCRSGGRCAAEPALTEVRLVGSRLRRQAVRATPAINETGAFVLVDCGLSSSRLIRGER
jgi:hypothetical protein